ncbi:potassium channel family protein [Ahniella affigens]|uniref:potassium channel family protein n=1 Tax=Ahniella affigens TaxID=2021234 RepID=UPI0011B252FC|nr:ion transporter [Ahniella affigens]
MNNVRERFGHWIGLAGVASSESERARRWYRRFEWILVPMAVWLPIQIFLEGSHEISQSIGDYLDWIIWTAFFLETVVLSCLVRRPWHYLRSNWLNLVIIIAGQPWFWDDSPFLPVARGLRLLMLISLIVHVGSFSREMLKRNSLGPTMIVLMLVTSLGGVLVAHFDPAFHSPWDGIWWAWVTVTTVGYGDLIPQSLAGRIFAVVLMLMGVGLIALLSATMAAYFRADEDREAERMRERIFRKLIQMDQEADERQKHTDLLLASLAKMEAEALSRQDQINELKLQLSDIKRVLERLPPPG